MSEVKSRARVFGESIVIGCVRLATVPLNWYRERLVSLIEPPFYIEPWKSIASRVLGGLFGITLIVPIIVAVHLAGVIGALYGLTQGLSSLFRKPNLKHSNDAAKINLTRVTEGIDINDQSTFINKEPLFKQINVVRQKIIDRYSAEKTFFSSTTSKSLIKELRSIEAEKKEVLQENPEADAAFSTITHLYYYMGQGVTDNFTDSNNGKRLYHIIKEEVAFGLLKHDVTGVNKQVLSLLSIFKNRAEEKANLFTNMPKDIIEMIARKC